NGTYHSPIWAPNATSFAFLRANALWVAAAPALPPEPTALDEAGRVVASFMDARLKGQSSEATRLLDDNGKKAYGDDALHLLPTGDPRFSRYYVLTQELVGNQPDTVRFVVRLVLTDGKIDVSNYEETLTLVRDSNSKEFRIDQATGGAHRAPVAHAGGALFGLELALESASLDQLQSARGAAQRRDRARVHDLAFQRRVQSLAERNTQHLHVLLVGLGAALRFGQPLGEKEM